MLSPETRIVIFGGSGFLGRYIINRLSQSGARLIAAVRRPEEASFLKTMGVVGQVEVIAANIRNAESIQKAVAGADIVINSVGILYQSGPQKFETVQAKAPGWIGKAAKEAGAQRFIHISAIGADEKGQAQYAKTKAAGEKAAQEAFPEVTILRPSVVFGPEDQFFNMFASMGRFAPVLPLIGGGKTKFQPVYVGDIAEAVEKALQTPDSQGKIYELGGPHCLSFKEVLCYIRTEARQSFCLASLPFGLATLQASVMQLMPKPLLTVDQVTLLKKDNVVHPDALTFEDLGLLEPKSIYAIVPDYLWQYRPSGRWNRAK